MKMEQRTRAKTAKINKLAGTAHGGGQPKRGALGPLVSESDGLRIFECGAGVYCLLELNEEQTARLEKAAEATGLSPDELFQRAIFLMLNKVELDAADYLAIARKLTVKKTRAGL